MKSITFIPRLIILVQPILTNSTVVFIHSCMSIISYSYLSIILKTSHNIVIEDTNICTKK